MKREAIEQLADHFILSEAQRDLMSTGSKSCRSMKDHWINLRLHSIVPLSKKTKLRDKMAKSITDPQDLIGNMVSFALNNPLEKVVTLAFAANWLVKKKNWNRIDRRRLYQFKNYLLNVLIFRFYWEDKIIPAVDINDRPSLPQTNSLIIDYHGTDPPDLNLGFLRAVQPIFDEADRLNLIRKANSVINIHLPCDQLTEEAAVIVAKALKKSEPEPVLSLMLLSC